MRKQTRIRWPWRNRCKQEKAEMFQMKQVGARIATHHRERDMTPMALADHINDLADLAPCLNEELLAALARRAAGQHGLEANMRPSGI